MEKILARLDNVQCAYSGYWAERIVFQLQYLAKYEHFYNAGIGGDLRSAVAELEERAASEGQITKSMVLALETGYPQLAVTAKKLEMLCVGHAHIDMNWQWGWHETVQLTIDTVRTVLDLMEKYPAFRFSQSQASVYQIIADHDPAMLEEVKQRIREQRWEVAAATWVEGDKNMTSAESEARQYLYAKRYLSGLLDIDIDSLTFEFEPDTFGHNANVPAIAAAAGVKYYYFCRGYDSIATGVFRWQAQSGDELLAFAEPTWYMHRMGGKAFQHLPEFCAKNNVEKTIVVFGVGDHGGGPTRKDIETIMDMQSWPFAPQVSFAFYQDFFKHAETKRSNLPVIKQEMNYVFDGCYTTAPRIKMANRFAEYALYDAELFSALAWSLNGREYRGGKLEQAWRNTVFNHFHDILPGSGVTETREYALGLFQQTMAVANTEKMSALRSIAAMIDTRSIFDSEDYGSGLAEGAGVAYGAHRFKMSVCQRADGKKRIYHVFNQLPFARHEVLEIPVWEWKYDRKRLQVSDSAGNKLAVQQLDERDIHSWGYDMFRIIVPVRLPAGGYETLILEEAAESPAELPKDLNPRTIVPETFRLENAEISAQFNPHGELLSYFDKLAGKELVKGEGGQFRLGVEGDKGMSAWTIWPFVSERSLHGQAGIKSVNRGAVRDALVFEAAHGQSSIRWEVSLAKDGSRLEYDIRVDWREFGRCGQTIPNLFFRLPLAAETTEYVNDIAAGYIARQSRDNDIPGLSYIAGGGLQLITDCKYGYRGFNNALQVTLIRSSNDPDEHPEAGTHYIRMALAPQAEAFEMAKNSLMFNKPPEIVSAYRPAGNAVLPLTASLFELCGEDVLLSALKKAEDSDALVVRAFSLADGERNAQLRYAMPLENCAQADSLERETGAVREANPDGSMSFELQPKELVTFIAQTRQK